MKSFRTYVYEANKTLGVGSKPEKIFQYYAYKNGEVTEHLTLKEANLVSHLIEAVVINQKEIDDWSKNTAQANRMASIQFHDDLRKQFDVDDNVYGLALKFCREHDVELDELYDKMTDLIDLIEEARKL